MKATTLLRNDHSAVKKLFRAYEKAEKADDNEKKTSVFDEIARELHIHPKVEEEIFYPAMRSAGNKKGVDEVPGALEEHVVVKFLRAQLKNLKPEDETYDAKVTVLIECVEHHAVEEESEMFPNAEKTLGDARLRDLGARIDFIFGEGFGSQEAR